MPPLLKLSGCRLTSKRGNGVKIEWGAGGEVVGCEVTAVHMTAVMVCDAADVAVRRNQIHDNEGAGVFLYGASGAHTEGVKVACCMDSQRCACALMPAFPSAVSIIDSGYTFGSLLLASQPSCRAASRRMAS